MRPITPIPSTLPTYAFACSSLNDLRLIDGEYANHFPVFVPMLYPIAKLLSKVYCASKWKLQEPDWFSLWLTLAHV